VVNAAPVESLDTASYDDAPPEPQLGADDPEESVEPVATETASALDETEIVDPLADFDLSRVKSLPSVRALLEATTKDVEARQAESYRQKALTAETEARRQADLAAYQRNQQELTDIDNGSAVNALYGVLNSVIDHDMDPDAIQRLQSQLPILGQMAQQLQRSTQTRTDQQQMAGTNEYLMDKFPDYRIAPDVVSKFDAALTRGDYKARQAILLDIVSAAAVAAAAPKLRAEAIKEVKAEAEKTLKLQQQQSSERTSEANGRPTPVNGRPANIGTYRTLAEVALAHMNGQLTNAQVRVYRAMPRDKMPEY
jgi:hypothetical protein